MSRGSLIIGAGNAHLFAVLQVPQGLPEYPDTMSDELQTGGVDGTLTILNRLVFRPFALQFLVSHTTLANAQAAAAQIMAGKGSFAESLNITSMGAPRTWRKVYIMSAMARAYRDVGGGPHALSSQGAVTDASIVVRPTKTPG